MIAIIVPAHDEQDRIEACVRSLRDAALHPGLHGEAVEIVVVLDACRDGTGQLARQLGARTIDVPARNVGLARRAGAAVALASGARWLAFTDADSVVAPDWLAAQLALNADVVCGTVAIEDWGTYGERMRRHFELTYTDVDGHAHIHGANLGVSALAYTQAGGFSGLSSGEDVALVEALRASSAHIVWSRAPRVVTSVRTSFKAPGGFGATLLRIEELAQWVSADMPVAA
ncbi:MAG: glycosyltransferase family 2 protein [Haliea sp.]|nr:MAG: glycosyltransferase family 2 protein [Haliea sp.]